MLDFARLIDDGVYSEANKSVTIDGHTFFFSEGEWYIKSAETPAVALYKVLTSEEQRQYEYVWQKVVKKYWDGCRDAHRASVDRLFGPVVNK